MAATTQIQGQATGDTTTSKLRAEYRRIRDRSVADNAATFDGAVKAYLEAHKLPATPENFVKAAKLVHFRCPRCAGTGAFITMVLNGVPTGPGGACFRCAGKGHQTDEDARRNWGHDQHIRVF